MAKYTLPILKYAYDDLEPFIDEKTMELHHRGHHQAYIDNLNSSFTRDNPNFNLNLRDHLKLLNTSVDLDPSSQFIKNNAGGHYNHSLFWLCMAKPMTRKSDYFEVIFTSSFKTNENFERIFTEKALKVFGSGWVWICFDKNAKILTIETSQNQDTPITDKLIPILAFDVWEHAYYLRYQNKRNEYIKSFLNIIDWEKVSFFYEKFAISGKAVNISDGGAIVYD